MKRVRNVMALLLFGAVSFAAGSNPLAFGSWERYSDCSVRQMSGCWDNGEEFDDDCAQYCNGAGSCADACEETGYGSHPQCEEYTSSLQSSPQQGIAFGSCDPGEAKCTCECDCTNIEI